MSKNLRDYGLPNPEPIGVPEWKASQDKNMTCPNCGANLCEVTVKAKMAQLTGDVGVCTYLGCPACPYASPSVTRSLTPPETSGAANGD
jgi:C4-type Zn-finger protein